ncbi:MAG: hypothetical protein OJF58_005053 [Enhydrobacter sp.]|nr:MAG: hypothetical protein OJF58_005053 [Enhydrobacter sp.]
MIENGHCEDSCKLPLSTPEGRERVRRPQQLRLFAVFGRVSMK